MGLTNAGRDFIAGYLTGHIMAGLDNANAHIGVGDSNAAFSVTQTDLQAVTNKFRKGMEDGYPTRVGNVMTFKSKYIGDEANFAWHEWAVFNAAVAESMVNRKVEYNGTKLFGQQWILETSLTINIGS